MGTPQGTPTGCTKMRLVIVVVLALITVLAFGACGKGEKPALSPQEYGEALADLQRDFVEETNRISHDFDQKGEKSYREFDELLRELTVDAPKEDLSEKEFFGLLERPFEKLRKTTTDFSVSILEVVKDLRNDVSHLRPASEIMDAHEEYILSVDATITELESYIDGLKDYEVEYDLRDALDIIPKRLKSSNPATALDKMHDACRELERSIEGALGNVNFCP